MTPRTKFEATTYTTKTAQPRISGCHCPLGLGFARKLLQIFCPRFGLAGKMIAAKTPHPVDKHVGERVRMYRIKAGMSQETLGRQLGLTFQQIQKYEKGTNRIGASRIQQISDILNIPVGSLFQGLPGPKRNETSDFLLNEFVEFLGTALGQRLVECFMKVQDRNVRTHLVQLIESIAESTGPGRKRTRKKST
jgi:transcriptional regulator with XRE-family HTH domain